MVGFPDKRLRGPVENEVFGKLLRIGPVKTTLRHASPTFTSLLIPLFFWQ
jgi:hypothetical protein